MKDKIDKVGALEAALFIHGEPMAFRKIEKLLSVSGEELREIITELENRLRGRGLELISQDAAAQLVSKSEFAEILESIVKEELTEELSPASQETLAIVAYLGPLPRAKIDFIRGVNSSFILRSLLLRGLLERSLDPGRGNVYFYSPSFELMRFLGLKQVQDLPEFTKYRKILENYNQSQLESVVEGEES